MTTVAPDKQRWLENGGAPLDLRIDVARTLMRECGATNGDANFAAAVVIDHVRKWVVSH